MEVAESLPEEQRQKWDRLHMLSDRRGGVAQPLIYPHPTTGVRTRLSRHTLLSHHTVLFAWRC